MANPPDATAWIPEKAMLELCDVSRSTLRSWLKSGLKFDLAERRAAYGPNEVVTVLIFAAARKHLSPKELVAAWEDLEGQGRARTIIDSAWLLRDGDHFDMVLDPKYSMLEVVFSDEELIAAVRTDEPRPLIVVDMAASLRRATSAFGRKANTTPQPARRKSGRPASANRLRVAGRDT